MIAFATAALIGAVVFPLSFDGSWAAWHDVIVIPDVAASAETFVRAPITGLDSGPDGTYPSLRVVDDTGAETPYALDPDAVRVDPAGHDLPVTDVGFTLGRYSQAVVDFGTDGNVHEAVKIEVRRDTFLTRVAVATSDDRTTWSTLRSDAMIYRVPSTQTGSATQASDTTIAFAPTHARWLRLRFLDASQPFLVTRAAETVRRSTDQALVSVGTWQPADAGTPALTQRWTFDFGGGYREIDGLEILGGRKFYARFVDVERSDDGTSWTPVETAIGIRHAGEPSLTHPIARTFARRIRVTLNNASDVPMRGVTLRMLAASRDLVFAAQPGRKYVLLSGNPSADAPRYDLGDVLARQTWHAVSVPLSGARAIPNQGFRDTRSITDRLPWLVELGFVLASLAIGALAFQTLRTTLQNPPAAPD